MMRKNVMNITKQMPASDRSGLKSLGLNLKDVLKHTLVSGLGVGLALAGGSVLAAEQSAQALIEKSNKTAVYSGVDGRTQARMLIVDKQGRKQQRQFTILRKNIKDSLDQQYLVFFSRPKDVARTSFLVSKHPGENDERWLYLPSLDLVKRIAAGDKRTSFVGSTFYYEDISGRDINADNFELISEDDSAWTIKATPKASKLVEFKYYVVKVSKQNFLPLKAEYFNAQDKLYRRISAEKIKTVQGYASIVQMKAENLNNGSYTITQMRNMEYDLGIDASVFTERSLRQPPRKWLSFSK